MARPKKIIEANKPKEVVLTESNEAVKPIVMTSMEYSKAVAHDKVQLFKNGRIIAMAVNRRDAEMICKENPNITIL